MARSRVKKETFTVNTVENPGSVDVMSGKNS